MVVQTTPVNGQETATDLSDPGVGGKWTLRFTETPKTTDLIDPTNPFNGVTSNVQILNQSFARVAGTPSVDAATKAFTFTPAGGTLTPAQYTITITKFVSTPFGKSLNLGLKDYSSSFTVGADTYNPVVRNVTPANNQNDVPLYNPVVITFNESLDPTSVVYGQTVIVQDGGTNPPTQLTGTLVLDRDGFDIVFKPDPCSGMPPATTVVVRMLAAGSTTFVKDTKGNPLLPDPALGGINEVNFQFNTKGIKPLPNPLNVYWPGTPRLGIVTLMAYVSARDKTYAFDTAAVVGEFKDLLRRDVGLTQQVTETNQVPVNIFPGQPPWFYGPAYGGDWEAKVGQAGESLIDWRYDQNTGHSYIYQLDEKNEAVAIINTGNGKVEGHFNGLGTPKGLGMSGIGIGAVTGLEPVLYISDYGQGTVTGIPLGSIIVGQPICTAVKELNDDLSRRVVLQAGRNPSGVAMEYYGISIGGVVNQADNELQVFDPATLQPINNKNGLGELTQRYQVGENPIDCGWSPITNVGIFAYVVNQGGPNQPNGSVSLWWSLGGFTAFAPSVGQVVKTAEQGIEVPGHCMPDPNALSVYIPNTGSTDVVRMDLAIVGGLIFATVDLRAGESRVVGDNPTSVTWTCSGIYPAFDVSLATLAGQGQVAVWGRTSVVGPPVLYNLPGARNCFSAWNE
jgi:hypothetical protein